MTIRRADSLRRSRHLTCILTLGIAALGLTSGCASMRPTIQDVSARVVAVDFTGVELAFDVAVRNNAFLGLQTPRGRYAVRIAETDVISSDDVPAATLPAGEVGVITLPANIRYLDLWAVANQYRESTEVPYALSGAMIFDVVGQSFSLDLVHEGTLPVLKLPKIAITSVDTSGFSLRGADVTVSAQLTNPNIFAVGLTNLGYALKLGDVEIGGVEIDTKGLVEPGETCTLTARCHLSPTSAAAGVLRSGSLGTPALRAVGTLTTPFGSVRVPES